MSNRTEALPPLPGTKFRPCACSGKSSTAPAIALDGKITLMAGPLVMTTIAVPEVPESATLVAVTVIAFGLGAAVGAV